MPVRPWGLGLILVVTEVLSCGPNIGLALPTGADGPPHSPILDPVSLQEKKRARPVLGPALVPGHWLSHPPAAGGSWAEGHLSGLSHRGPGSRAHLCKVGGGGKEHEDTS
jgi:hypothetical protein